jgi:hypothetical protein
VCILPDGGTLLCGEPRSVVRRGMSIQYVMDGRLVVAGIAPSGTRSVDVSVRDLVEPLTPTSEVFGAKLVARPGIRRTSRTADWNLSTRLRRIDDMRRYVVLTILGFALIAPPAAAADGVPPVGADAGPAGLTMPGIAYRWVTVRVHGHTLIAVIEKRGGRIDISRIAREPLVIPAVTYNGAATGLSADGTTLVLARERRVFPRRSSSFTMFDANTLRPLRTISLRGDFTLDAVSPDGGRLYFIQAKTLTRYAVRAYDAEQGRLLPGAIVDPEEAEEPMEGLPLDRAMSPDGRWAYTLYDNDGKEWFIHALDTERGEARCIDLVGAPPMDTLSVGRNGTLLVKGASGERTVDLRTFAVRDPHAATAPARRSSAGGGGGWTGVTAGVALLALLAVGAARAGALRSR